MKKFRNENGITLVALVITIIVLLILAGVTIAMVVGDNGILTRAKTAKEMNDYKSGEEELSMTINEAYTENLGSLTLQQAAGAIYKKYEDTFYSDENENSKIENTGDDDSPQFIITDDFFWVKHKNGYLYKVLWNNGNVDISYAGVSNNEDETNVISTQDVTINKKSTEATKVQQLLISDKMLAGGAWESRNSSIATVDQSGNVTWGAVGKTKVVYIAEDGSKEVFNLRCTLSIPVSIDGWQSVHDCGMNGSSSVSGGNSFLGATIWGTACVAAGIDNTGIYHVTIYRTLDLTNVSSISYRAVYSHDTGMDIMNGFQTGLVDGNSSVEAECSYDSQFYTSRDMTISNREDSFDVMYDVSKVSGNRILAFTVTHPNRSSYSVVSGYYNEILLEP